MNDNKQIIVLTGPTGSGKTALSYEIANKYTCEIICADSMTVYRGMDIGTDKPTLEIRDREARVKNEDGAYIVHGIPHHLIDVVNPDEEFNVAIFIEDVQKLIDEIHSRNHIPMLVGGSVMYIDALVYQYSMPEVKPDLALRAHLEEKTAEELFDQLCEFDPDVEWTVDRHNKRRLIREIEVFLATGKPFSEQKERSPLPGNVLYLAVDREREKLYHDIDKRVDKMFQQGFVDEVRELHRLYDHDVALHAAGYWQIIQCLDGEITLEQAIEKTKQAHRNYAKRQLTWLRKNSDVHWVSNDFEVVKLIDGFLQR